MESFEICRLLAVIQHEREMGRITPHLELWEKELRDELNISA
jgi:hypothetical protein